MNPTDVLAHAHAAMDDAEELLTIAQAAIEATRRAGPGFNRDTLRRHVRKGALVAVRVGPSKLLRIRRADLNAYLQPQ